MKVISFALVFWGVSISASFLAQADGVIAADLIWTKNPLKVCFAQTIEDLKNPKLILARTTEELNDENFAPFPAWIVANAPEAVQKSFLGTSRKFVGWEDCSKTKDPDVILSYSTLNQGRLSTPISGDPARSILPQAKDKTITSVRINHGFLEMILTELEVLDFLEKSSDIQGREVLYKSIVMSGLVHEFGHVVGLQHEHLRDDGDEEISKIDFGNNLKFLQESREGEKAKSLYRAQKPKPVGDYSPFSVMNYFSNEFFIDLYRLKRKCELSPSEKCNVAFIQELLPSLNHSNGYFHESDIEVINFLYDGVPVRNAWKQKSQQLIDWLSSLR